MGLEGEICDDLSARLVVFERAFAYVYVLCSQAGGQSPKSRVVEFVKKQKARLKEDNRGPQWIRRCEDLLNEINQVINPERFLYYEDMYVSFKLSDACAAKTRGIRTWVTNEYMHSGIREDGPQNIGSLVCALERRGELKL
ncbi:hypothetical protein R1flu_014836 [Riccia fluitans]|uniref:Uncharacterized protein n=1 Tax=Riccia fluitans TaxID=41844 RepID=A0ABD1YHM1_9MARC